MKLKYKVGDKVRVIKECIYHIRKIGDICTIKKIDTPIGKMVLPYCIKKGHSSQWVRSADIEPYTPPVKKPKQVPKSHKENVLKHLQKQPITPIQALNSYGCYRLSDVIFRLRNDGYNIITERIGKQGYAKYSLIKRK